MSESYRALANDFYVNQRLNLKMDLPANRETILSLFDRVRREFPAMDRFKRLPHELALESDSREGPQQWLALRKTNLRSGCINPGPPGEAYELHRLVLEIAPYFLSISPLDIDYLELLYGFDLVAAGNHDAIVLEALFAGSPIGRILDLSGAIPIDCQPLFGLALTRDCDLQAHFEIKTRTPTRAVRTGEFHPEPISLYLTLRRYGAVGDVGELHAMFKQLSDRGEELLESRVIPSLLMPIREAIGSGNV